MPGIPPIGKLHKLTIQAHDTVENAESGGSTLTSPAESVGTTFVAFYNPDSVTSTFGVTYDEKIAAGDTNMYGSFKAYAPATYSFTLMFDGTGASVPAGLGIDTVKASTFVSDQITQLKNVTYFYHGSNHRPKYLSLSWGKTYVETCVLTSMAVTYNMFHPNGNPLRATVKCDFKEAASSDARKAAQKKESPDITHLRTVRAGDKLPLLCAQVYGDPKLYLEVAKYNNLRNHRDLEPGQQLYFPPLIQPKS